MIDVSKIVYDFRLARLAALHAVRAEYPIGTKVRLMSGGVTARVFSHSGDCPDLVNLLFENGNVWTKTVDQFEKLEAAE